jgi:uncharacterized membrane protein
MPDMKTDGPAFNTARLETFSDAVMAVAITLMVLHIDAPQTSPGQSLGQAFVQVTLPAIIYFLITFAVIVLFWMHHHDLFIRLPEFTPVRAFWLNMGFLAMICLLPFGLEFFSTQSNSYVTVSVYAGLMALATLFLGALARQITGRWPAGVGISIFVFLLAIPFASLIGGWCLLVWWIDQPIQRIWSARHPDADANP